jgi:hypothetical protein
MRQGGKEEGKPKQSEPRIDFYKTYVTTFFHKIFDPRCLAEFSTAFQDPILQKLPNSTSLLLQNTTTTS